VAKKMVEFRDIRVVEDPTPETGSRYWKFNRLPKKCTPDV